MPLSSFRLSRSFFLSLSWVEGGVFEIALAALHMASVMLGRDLKAWFSELSVDMEAVQEVRPFLPQS